jgi:membrane associated rhomboid family serine protease
MLLINNLLFLINIIIFISYNSNLINVNNLCKETFLNNIAQNFTHLDSMHIIFNLYALYNISNLETIYTSQTYFQIIILLTLMQSTLTYIINKFYKLNCSIGFSGVIMGLYVFNIFKTNQNNLNSYLIALALLIYPSFVAQNVSLVGHLIGGLSGYILSYFF